MSAVAFDTLKFAQTLRDKANFSPTQAEGISQAFSEAIASQLATRDDLSDLATKEDLAALGTAMKGGLDALRTATKDDLAALRTSIASLDAKIDSKTEASKSEMIKWMVGAIGLQTIIVLGAVVALARIVH